MDIVTLNCEQKELITKFIQRVKETSTEVESLKEQIKDYNQIVKDDITNVNQRTGIDKKILSAVAKKISEPEKVREQQEIQELVDALLEIVGKK